MVRGHQRLPYASWTGFCSDFVLHRKILLESPSKNCAKSYSQPSLLPIPVVLELPILTLSSSPPSPNPTVSEFPSMANSARDIYQNLVDDDIGPIRVEMVHEKDLTRELIETVVPPGAPRFVGLSAGYSDKGRLVAIAIANQKPSVLVVRFGDKVKATAGSNDAQVTASLDDSEETVGGRQLLQNLLCCEGGDIFAFDLAALTLLLYSTCQLYLSGGVNVQSAFNDRKLVSPLEAYKQAIGKDAEKYTENFTDIFDRNVFDPNRSSDIALRAWVAVYIASRGDVEARVAVVPRINSKNFSPQQLRFLSKLAQDTMSLDQQKAPFVEHSVTSGWDSRKNQIRASSNQYQNKLHKHSKGKKIQVTVQDRGNVFVIPGQVSQVQGKNARISVSGDLSHRAIGTIITSGHESLTFAEQQRNLTVLHILQGKKELMNENPWIQNIWLASSLSDMQWPSGWAVTVPALPPTPYEFDHPLNDSQQFAVEQMMSQDNHLVLIQGPPGTGKTSVIASFVKIAIQQGRKGIWLVAQSNVAVKNIAEKLLDYGFQDFRLLVSSDFHDDWHEHLYLKFQRYIILSQDFNQRASRPPLDCHVILCTLSMVSNPLVRSSGFTQQIPIGTLVVDEASQIEVGNYLPVFTTFAQSIRKLCFIGDDKQLPPFNQEQIEDLQSIFEISHIRPSAILLNTQYRMPPQLGDFISDAVYDGQLQSNPLHPAKDVKQVCYLIDANGAERQQGDSYLNSHESDAVRMIAEHLQSKGKSFRIITPYEAQRNLLEQTLKKHDLAWQDKCFNVDSFQGNEDDFIILSLVRTKRVGFLKDMRRNNVMLTRCRHGMFICTHRRFLEETAQDTLVGKLLAYYGEDHWLEKPEDLALI